MENCRNCKHALWMTSERGYRLYQYVAYCRAKVDTSGFPAAAAIAVRTLARPMHVASHANTPVDCPRWEKYIRVKPDKT